MRSFLLTALCVLSCLGAYVLFTRDSAVGGHRLTPGHLVIRSESGRILHSLFDGLKPNSRQSEYKDVAPQVRPVEKAPRQSDSC